MDGHSSSMNVRADWALSNLKKNEEEEDEVGDNNN